MRQIGLEGITYLAPCLGSREEKDSIAMVTRSHVGECLKICRASKLLIKPPGYFIHSFHQLRVGEVGVAIINLSSLGNN